MKLILAALVFTFLPAFISAEERFVYLSAGGNITVYTVDLESGKLSEIQSVSGAGLTAISDDKKHLYRIGGKQAETYAIQSDGTLKSLGKNRSAEKTTYLDLDATQKYLAGSDYGGGRANVWRIGEDHLITGEAISTIGLEKAAHSAVFSPDNRFLYIPATTPNKIFQLAFDAETGSIVPHDPPSVPGPTETGSAQQPRHLTFHPTLPIAYTTLEREVPGVGVWSHDAESGNLEVIANIPTTPSGFTGAITTADLHLTPDARFLYVSNRDLTDRKAVTGDSSLVGFSVDPGDGSLTLIGHTPAPQVPRAFRIDEAGDYLYAAGQTAAKLAVYQIDKETGALDRIEELDTGKGPNWVRCLTLP